MATDANANCSSSNDVRSFFWRLTVVCRDAAVFTARPICHTSSGSVRANGTRLACRRWIGVRVGRSFSTRCARRLARQDLLVPGRTLGTRRGWIGIFVSVSGDAFYALRRARGGVASGGAQVRVRRVAWGRRVGVVVDVSRETRRAHRRLGRRVVTRLAACACRRGVAIGVRCSSDASYTRRGARGRKETALARVARRRRVGV